MCAACCWELSRPDGSSTKKFTAVLRPACVHQCPLRSAAFRFQCVCVYNVKLYWQWAWLEVCRGNFTVSQPFKLAFKCLVSSQRPLDWCCVTVSQTLLCCFCSLRLSGTESLSQNQRESSLLFRQRFCPEVLSYKQTARWKYFLHIVTNLQTKTSPLLNLGYIRQYYPHLTFVTAK